MFDFFKKIGGGAGIGLVFAVIIRILIPVPMRFMFALVLFGAVAEIICEQYEKESATKRTAKRLALVAVAIGAFIAFRLAAGQLFGMPINAGVASFFGDKAASGEEFQAGVLELLFLLPGAGLAYAVAYGGKARNFAIGLAVLGFFLVLWQVKQPANSQSAGLRSQSFINWTTRANNQAAAKTTTKKSWAVAKSKVPRVYRISLDADGGMAKPPEIVEGLSLVDQEVVKLSSTPPVVYQDQGFVAFRVYDALTGVVGSEELWVEAEAIEPLDAVEYQDGKVVPARPKDTLSANYAVRVFNFKPGERVPTGIVLQPGDMIRFESLSAPFKYCGRIIDHKQVSRAKGVGEVVLYGLEQAGQVSIRAVN